MKTKLLFVIAYIVFGLSFNAQAQEFKIIKFSKGTTVMWVDGKACQVGDYIEEGQEITGWEKGCRWVKLLRVTKTPSYKDTSYISAVKHPSGTVVTVSAATKSSESCENVYYMMDDKVLINSSHKLDADSFYVCSYKDDDGKIKMVGNRYDDEDQYTIILLKSDFTGIQWTANRKLDVELVYYVGQICQGEKISVSIVYLP